MSRPFGVALLIAGWDENGPALFHTVRSGSGSTSAAGPPERTPPCLRRNPLTHTYYWIVHLCPSARAPFFLPLRFHFLPLRSHEHPVTPPCSFYSPGQPSGPLRTSSFPQPTRPPARGSCAQSPPHGCTPYRHRFPFERESDPAQQSRDGRASPFPFAGPLGHLRQVRGQGHRVGLRGRPDGPPGAVQARDDPAGEAAGGQGCRFGLGAAWAGGQGCRLGVRYRPPSAAL